MPTNAINDTGVKYLYDKLHGEIEGCINDDVETVIGNPLNFSTKFAQHAKSTKLTLEPIQDLHGYDKPWVGGAGKNKFNIDLVELTNCNVNGLTVSNKITDTRYTVAFQVQLFNDSTFVQLVVSQTINSNGKFAVGFTISSGTSYNKLHIKHNGISQDVVICAMPFNKVGQFAISFNVTGYDPSVVGGMVFSNIQLEEGPQATSYEPYENLCPISGYDEIDLNEFGENLANVEFEQGAISSNIGLPYSGCKVSNNTRIRCENLIALNPNTDYILKLGNANYRYIIQTFDSQQLYYTESYSNQWTDTDTTFSGAPYIAIAVKKSDESDISVSEYVEADIKLIEQDSISNLSIDLPSTVYGGVLDLESGELVADWKIEDLGNYDWEYNSQYSVFISQSLVNHKVGDTNLISSDYETSESTSVANLRDYTIKGNGVYAATLYVKDPRYNDATIFKTAVNGVQICYELATPQTIQLTPHQLNLFKEQNNISSNATSISVTYKKGILTVIEPATESSDGIMSAADKQKLDLIADDATKTESSTTNGNIKINGTETQVYDDSEIKGELTTDTTTVEGNPLNFTTLSAQTAKSTILSLEPIQDLHGYDKPWVGGAGKNKLPMTVDGLKSINLDGTWVGNVYTHENGVIFTIITDSDNNILGIKAKRTATTNNADFKFATITATSDMKMNIAPSGSDNDFYFMISGTSVQTTGSDVSVPNGTSGLAYLRIKQNYNVNDVVFQPMIRLATETDATFTPYENKASISGRTEIGILGCGKNFITNYQANKSIDGSGQINTDNNTCLSNNISVLPNTTYALSWTKTSDAVVAHCFDENNNYLQYVRLGIVSPQIISTNNLPVGTENIYIQWNKTNEGNVLPTNGQFEISNHATTYEPYAQSNDLTISLGQTVYGCQIKVEEGKIVVNSKRIDLGDLRYAYDTTNHQYFTNVISDAKTTQSMQTEGILCSDYVVDSREYSVLPTVHIRGIFSGDKRLYIAADSDSYSFSGVQLLYPLATPTVVNLAPNTINLLKGVNNIYTDGDSITLTYRDGSVATLGDLTSAVDNLDSKIDESKILTDTATGDKYVLVVTNGVLSVEQISN